MIFLWLVLCCVLFLSCGGDDEILKEKASIANFVSATPPGGCVAPNGTITGTFDNPPRHVKVNVGTVKVVGKTAIISSLFTPGPLPITLTWAGGTQAFHYSNVGPC